MSALTPLSGWRWHGGRGRCRVRAHARAKPAAQSRVRAESVPAASSTRSPARVAGSVVQGRSTWLLDKLTAN